MRLGHLAFSQTVSKRNSVRILEVRWLTFPFGTSRRNQVGNRRDGSKIAFVPAEPQTAVGSESPVLLVSDTTGRSMFMGNNVGDEEVDGSGIVAAKLNKGHKGPEGTKRPCS